jgi:hypothetical protein
MRDLRGKTVRYWREFKRSSLGAEATKSEEPGNARLSKSGQLPAVVDSVRAAEQEPLA